MTLLEVKNLSKSFVNKGITIEAVNKVSFKIEAGQCVGLLGGSGSGKSTIAKLLTRLIDHTEGEIYLEGQDISQYKGRELASVYEKMQLVFQEPRDSFDPRLTLGKSISEPLLNRGYTKGAIKERLGKLLEQCGLPLEIADRYPHQVSGGQCQRAAIARALALGPKLLICDEATSALDYDTQREILKLLQRLGRENKLALLFISHDISLVEQLCDYVLVMDQGQLVEGGFTKELLANPQASYTKSLIAAAF